MARAPAAALPSPNLTAPMARSRSSACRFWLFLLMTGSARARGESWRMRSCAPGGGAGAGRAARRTAPRTAIPSRRSTAAKVCAKNIAGSSMAT